MNRFEKLVHITLKPWVLLPLVALIVVSFMYLDKPIAIYFHDLDLRTNLPVLNWITKLAYGGVYLYLFLCLALYFRFVFKNREKELKAWFLWFAVLIPAVLCTILKIGFGRARPALFFEEQFYGFYWFKTTAKYWSFPSGHTTTIMSVTIGLAVLFPRFTYQLLLLGLAIASTRIFLVHHFLSDVLTASLLTLIEIACLLYFLKRKSWLAPLYCSKV